MEQKIMLGCPGVEEVLEVEVEFGCAEKFAKEIGASKLEVKTLPVPLYLVKDADVLAKVREAINKKQ